METDTHTHDQPGDPTQDTRDEQVTARRGKRQTKAKSPKANQAGASKEAPTVATNPTPNAWREESPGKAPHYPQSLGSILQHIFEPLCQRKPQMRMMMDWPLIVGNALARWTWPVKIQQSRLGPGVLYIQVDAAHYFDAWSQSLVYLERVNQYMGYGAVHRVHFTRVDSMKRGEDSHADTV